MNEIELQPVETIANDIGPVSENLIAILQAIQHHYGYLPKQALEHLAKVTDLSARDIAGVSTFYSQFRHKPVGKHVVCVCHGTACHVKGAPGVTDALRRHLKIEDGEDTDADGLFTVEKVACLGCCTLAPAVQIGDITFGHINAGKVEQMLKDYLFLSKLKEQDKKQAKPIGPAQGIVKLGLGSCCIARGSDDVRKAVQATLEQYNINATIKPVGCVGMCHQTPLMEIELANGKSHLYAQVQCADVEKIILKHFRPPKIGKKIVAKLRNALDEVLSDGAATPASHYGIGLRDKPVAAFLDRQKHITTEYHGQISPPDLQEYLDKGGFEGLKKCFSHKQQDIIDIVTESQIRGRGGGGFPSGIKWQIAFDAKAEKKYLICNGDEGDPGAFMDRMLLESYPYRVIEGLIIAAYAIGAHEALFYIRAEYPLALLRVKEALEQCRKQKLLGNNILHSDFSIDIKIVEGAGAFVCGEETALIASIMGQRGMPQIRPPYPAVKGLHDCPTIVNNVETLATLPWLILNGAKEFNSIGSESSKGTKVFALAGKIERGGLVEVPMGITIREIIEDIGGGVPAPGKLKAVQIGGPSGGTLPGRMLDVKVDYKALQQAGAIMGSGGLIVLDDRDCMVDIARYFLEFTQDQSCGKCTFCRVGTKRMLEILDRFCKGKAVLTDIDKLHELALSVKHTSLCGLGKTAPNPILSTLEYFKDEYIAHIEGRCPAGKCPDLIRYEVNDNCIGCVMCARVCPVSAIEYKPYEKHEIDTEKCIRCNGCKDICPEDAIDIIS
ncbi:MAG: NADH-quinone oxidoreductase subunit NuoE [Phycisphaerae bacterium]|nr:NADH-quinone oxidoreductase subunit NuoE [Phycisphaerae bacterium]